MAEFFASGRAVDLVLCLIVAEAALLLVLRRRIGGPPVASLLVFLGAGAALMLGLRAALTAAGWETVAAWMLVGLVAHLADLALRWKRPG
jgi:hypothetical protein